MNLLLVNNDQRIVKFVKRGLEAEGYRVDVARSGEEGLVYGRNPYSLIILDLLLPGVDGTEVCRTLRKDKIHTPILILSSRNGLQDIVESLQTGADDFLTKPFAFEDLLARVHVLRHRCAYRDVPTSLQILDLCLTQETREVTRAGQLISLTAKEFSLLEYLMSHPYRPLSRTMLLEQVWGNHHDTSSNVVDVFIRYLRNKVDKGYSQKLIHTVRGIGYKIFEQ